MKLPKSATIMWNSKDYRRKMPRYRLAFVLLILITAGIVSIAIWNTVKLQNAIHSRTLIYVDDVSDQIADSVDLRLTEITIDLQTLSDSVSLTGLSRHAYLSSWNESSRCWDFPPFSSSFGTGRFSHKSTGTLTFSNWTAYSNPLKAPPAFLF